MAHATLMVNLELGQSNAAVLAVTNGLAKRMGAAVIGIAARQPMQILYTDGCYVSPDVVNQDRAQIDREMRDAEAEFRHTIRGPALEWRWAVTYEAPSSFVTQQARGADLVLTGMRHGHVDPTRVAVDELLMQTGRPVMVVPQTSAHASIDRVVLAWKDTREARRAALDAIPLLKQAAHVCVVEIAGPEELTQAKLRLADVVAWLQTHGIAAETLAAVSLDNDAHQLRTLAAAQDADLIVAGAYGHSRLREWALGGVTRDLLQSDRCALLSH